MQFVVESFLRKQFSTSLRSETSTFSNPYSVTRSRYLKMLPVVYQRQSHSDPKLYCFLLSVATHAVGWVRGNFTSFSKMRYCSLCFRRLLSTQTPRRSSSGSILLSYFDIFVPPIIILNQRNKSKLKYRCLYISRTIQKSISELFGKYYAGIVINIMVDRRFLLRKVSCLIIVIMRGHQTYSLNTILNASQIRPQVYQQILHDIKSPLEQVSIDLTHDNSLESDPPRRPNIPPAPPRSPLNTLAQFNLSRTHESVSLSVKQSPQKEHFHDEVIESVLSPLDQQISFKEEPKAAPFFCGGLMESILRSENSFEVQLPPRSKLYKRRPIFEGSRVANLVKPVKFIEEVVVILRGMGEYEMALFFQLLRDLEQELGRVSREKEEIKKYLGFIYDKLSANVQFIGEQEQGSLATYRILRRLRSKNTYQLITKIVKERGTNRAAQADKKLEAFLESLARLESIIAKFMEKKEAVEILESVYESLQENYPKQDTLIRQIVRLCDSFNCRLNMEGFQLIWKDGDRRRISKDQFVEGISMNDYVVRLPKNFEEDLQSKGFRRNQQ